MEATLAFDVDRLPELYEVDEERLALAKQRQTAVWEGKRPDRWPIAFSAGLAPSQTAIPAPDLEVVAEAGRKVIGEEFDRCGVSSRDSGRRTHQTHEYGTDDQQRVDSARRAHHDSDLLPISRLRQLRKAAGVKA